MVNNTRTTGYEITIDSDIGRLEMFCTDTNMRIGYLQMNIDDAMLEFCDLWIDNEPTNFRGQGFGTILVKAGLNYATSHQVDFIFGLTADEDYPVHKFYTNLGFTIDDVTKDGTVCFRMSLHNSLDNYPSSMALIKQSAPCLEDFINDILDT